MLASTTARSPGVSNSESASRMTAAVSRWEASHGAVAGEVQHLSGRHAGKRCDETLHPRPGRPGPLGHGVRHERTPPDVRRR